MWYCIMHSKKYKRYKTLIVSTGEIVVNEFDFEQEGNAHQCVNNWNRVSIDQSKYRNETIQFVYFLDYECLD